MTSYEDCRIIVLDALLGIKSIAADRRAALAADPAQDLELATLGIDSMAVIDLCMDIEEKTGHEVLIDELVNNPTLNSFSRHLHSCL